MITFETDNHFLIGKRHVNSGKPCQDFALSGLLEGGASYAIIADGCSSGRHTGMGAQVLTFATARAINQQWVIAGKSSGDRVPQEISLHREIQVEGVKSALGLKYEDMLATCVYAFLSPAGGFIHVHGDGVLAYKMRSGEIVMTRYDWNGNAPAYPVYASDNYKNYIQSQGGDPSAKLLISQTHGIKSDGNRTDVRQEEYALGNSVQGITQHFSMEELQNIEYLAVFSDGVTQVENIEWQDVVQKLLSFKTTKGEFVKRRLIFAMREAEQTGKGPIDDVACAVVKVSLPQPTQPENAN